MSGALHGTWRQQAAVQCGASLGRANCSHPFQCPGPWTGVYCVNLMRNSSDSDASFAPPPGSRGLQGAQGLCRNNLFQADKTTARGD